MWLRLVAGKPVYDVENASCSQNCCADMKGLGSSYNKNLQMHMGSIESPNLLRVPRTCKQGTRNLDSLLSNSAALSSLLKELGQHVHRSLGVLECCTLPVKLHQIRSPWHLHLTEAAPHLVSSPGRRVELTLKEHGGLIVAKLGRLVSRKIYTPEAKNRTHEGAGGSQSVSPNSHKDMPPKGPTKSFQRQNK